MSLFGCTNFNSISRKCDDCSTEELNRIVHFAFIRKGATVNPNAIVASILALELTCDAFIIRNISGTMGEAAYQDGRGFGTAASRVLSARHTINIVDSNGVDNIDKYWNPMIEAAPLFEAWFFTSTMAWKIDKTLTVKPKMPITDNIETFIETMVEVTWSSKTLPVPYMIGTTDVNLLEECPTLFTPPLIGFQNLSGSGATITDGYDFAIDTNDVINAQMDANIQLASVTVESGSLPDGISFSIDTANKELVKVTGTATETGSFDAQLRVSNACGVASLIDISFIVTT